MSVSLSADLVINGISFCFLGGTTKVFSTNGFIHLLFKNGREGDIWALKTAPPFPACRHTPYYDNSVERAHSQRVSDAWLCN